MPRVSLGQPKRDYAKALILERKDAYGYTDEQLGKMLGLSRQTFSRLLHTKHTDEWTVKQLTTICRKLGVPIEELRESIRY